MRNVILFHALIGGPSAQLRDVDLSGADIGGADMSGANLTNANLTDAILVHAIAFADFTNANLTNTDLRAANLINATLTQANLTGADLSYASIRGVGDLVRSDLQEVNPEEMTLPDGTLWTEETDLTRFTDVNNPDYWRSDDPDSPAYGGE